MNSSRSAIFFFLMTVVLLETNSLLLVLPTPAFSLFRRMNLYVKHNYLNDHTQYFK